MPRSWFDDQGVPGYMGREPGGITGHTTAPPMYAPDGALPGGTAQGTPAPVAPTNTSAYANRDPNAQWTRGDVLKTLQQYSPTKEGLAQAVRDNPWLGKQVGNGDIKNPRTGEIWDVIGNEASGSGHWQTLTGHTAAAAAAKAPPAVAPAPMTLGGMGGGMPGGGGGGAAAGSTVGQSGHLAGFTAAPYQYDPFTAPDPNTFQQDPSYQWRLNQGLNTLQGSAASKGLLYDPKTLKAMQDYGQGSASQEYGAAYNRALTSNQANNQGRLSGWQANTNADLGYGSLSNQVQSTANQYALGQGNIGLGYYSAGNQFALGQGQLALGNKQADQGYALGQGQLGLGQGQLNLATQGQNFNQGYSLANLGLQAAGLSGGYGGVYGQTAGNLLTGQGNATAAGQIGSGNAYSGALGTLGNAGLAYGMYKSLYPNGMQ